VSCGQPTHAQKDVAGDAHGVAPIGLDEHVLDTLCIHQRREFNGSVEVPLHPSTWSALTDPRLERLGRRTQAHDEDVRARYRLPKAVELGARLEDPRESNRRAPDRS